MQKGVTSAVVQNSLYFIGMVIFTVPLLGIYLLFCPYYWGNYNYGEVDHYDYLNGFDFL